MTLAFTWWGHATTTAELAGARAVTDPLLDDRLLHLRRRPEPCAPGVRRRRRAALAPAPRPPAPPVAAPVRARGADRAAARRRGAARRPAHRRGLRDRRLLPVEPGDELEVVGVRIGVLAASHDHHRGSFSRATGRPIGYRLEAAERSCWFPGDSALRTDAADVPPVDLALVPVGGWGRTLGAGHMDPADAAVAVERVGARSAVPVHWGTFWPVGLRRLAPANHERLFVTPGPRFAVALTGSPTAVLLPRHGERVVLD